MRDPLITARAIAELLGVSPETILRWTRRGELPAVRLPGGAIRYQPEELEAWLERRTTTSADTADRELSDARTDHARRAAPYSTADLVSSGASDARPPEAATTEEDEDAR